MLKKVVFGLTLLVFLYTRIVGLDWGLPYPMHPDERNMAEAVRQLKCDQLLDIRYWQKPHNLITNNKYLISECLNPHFFAYGQLPLYAAYFGIQTGHLLSGTTREITFDEATMALRIISVVASIINFFVLLRIITLLYPKKSYTLHVTCYMMLTFSPYFIQFSHFGTTESLLMLFYTTMVYLSLKRFSTNNQSLITNNFLLALFSGLAIATKVSSIIFLVVPITTILFIFFLKRNQQVMKALLNIVRFLLLTLIVTIMFSPQTFISFPEFFSSLMYESSVAVGTYVPFYTRQFVGSIPLLFQFSRIFPYALGWPQFVLALLGFLFLSWKNKYVNVLRFAFLVYFVPTAFTFAKWLRFMTPVFPIMSVFAILFLLRFPKKIIIIIIAITIIPGFSYLSIYQQPDVRFTVSEWIYKNIPANSKILSETANVVDIPIPNNYSPITNNYQLASFNFYDLDQDRLLQNQLNQLIEAADYIFVPSRRIFKNHPASNYPILNNYYQQLFSGALGFKKVAEFSSYPKISLFGKTILEFPDEAAEETWSVFDHPVIRIYKKVQSQKSIKSKEGNTQRINLNQYATTNFRLSTLDFRLLVADTPQKWEQGLMYVRNKKEIGGLDGMIFLFPSTNGQSFWNKNTVTDLDLYWINNNKIVGTSSLPSIEKSKQIVTVSSPEKVNKVIEIIK